MEAQVMKSTIIHRLRVKIDLHKNETHVHVTRYYSLVGRSQKPISKFEHAIHNVEYIDIIFHFCSKQGCQNGYQHRFQQVIQCYMRCVLIVNYFDCLKRKKLPIMAINIAYIEVQIGTKSKHFQRPKDINYSSKNCEISSQCL